MLGILIVFLSCYKGHCTLWTSSRLLQGRGIQQVTFIFFLLLSDESKTQVLKMKRAKMSEICLHVVVASFVGFYYTPFNKISKPHTGAINQYWTWVWWQSLLSLPDSDQPWPVRLGTPMFRLCVLAKMTAVEMVHCDISSWHPCIAHDNCDVISSHLLL